MAETETKFFCPVCGDTDLDENQGTLYCRRCQIFVGRTTSFADFATRKNSKVSSVSHNVFAQTPLSVDFLGTLIQSINGILLALGGIFLGSSAVMDSATSPSPEFLRVFGLAVLMLFFGIIFWKLGAHLKHLEKGAWAALFVMHLLLLYIFGESFIRLMLEVGIEPAFTAFSEPRDLLPMLGFLYPSFVLLFLLLTVRHFK